MKTIKNYFDALKKVTWPAGKEARNFFFITLIIIIILILLVGFMDLINSYVISYLYA